MQEAELQEAELQAIRKAIRAEFPEYAAIHSHVLQEVLARLDKPYQAFFRRLTAGEKAGFPRYQASGARPLPLLPLQRGRLQRGRQWGHIGNGATWQWGHSGATVGPQWRMDCWSSPRSGVSPSAGRVGWSRRMVASAGRVGWSRRLVASDGRVGWGWAGGCAQDRHDLPRSGRVLDGYYVCFSWADVPVQPRPPRPLTGQETGIDLGIEALATFATLSDGTRLFSPSPPAGSPGWYRKAERALKTAQRRVSRRGYPDAGIQTQERQQAAAQGAHLARQGASASSAPTAGLSPQDRATRPRSQDRATRPRSNSCVPPICCITICCITICCITICCITKTCRRPICSRTTTSPSGSPMRGGVRSFEHPRVQGSVRREACRRCAARLHQPHQPHQPAVFWLRCSGCGVLAAVFWLRRPGAERLIRPLA